MADAVISVTCKNSKREIIKLWHSEPDWAAISIFGDTRVNWLAKGAIASGSSEFWERLDTQPVLGEIYTLQVITPFSANSNQPFWIFYEPALTSFNGLGNHPEEIPRCCLVQATLLDIIEYGQNQYGGDYAWINIHVQQVIPLPEIIHQFPPDHYGDACRMVQQNLSNSYYKVEWKEWTLISIDNQSHCGGWVVVQNYKGSQTIILYCDWWTDIDDLYAGNRPLTQKEWTHLNSMV